MADFTFEKYKQILVAFLQNNYSISGFANSLSNTSETKRLILRHDVDRFPNNALKMAQIEADLGIKATYFFRIIPTVFKPDIIAKIASLGHEIGYHYEDLSLCSGDVEKAIKHFDEKLTLLRVHYPISTICMHGSPLSKWDNKMIWKTHNYKDFGIIGDTSFDVNYDDFFYVSDNGRAWNRTSVSIRDKVKTKYDIPIKNSNHFVDLINSKVIPDRVMLNCHPDTFFNFGIKYLLNFLFIETKNSIKWLIVKFNLIK